MRCFEAPKAEQLTDHEIVLEILHLLTGLCYCNLCKALKINGWKDREDTHGSD